MGKEILLIADLQQTGISRGCGVSLGVIPMHEPHAREVSLLRSWDTTIRPTATTMRSMRTDLDRSAEETRASASSKTRSRGHERRSPACTPVSVAAPKMSSRDYTLERQDSRQPQTR